MTQPVIVPSPPPWHALPVEDALERLGAHIEGLSEGEAAARLDAYGPNALPEAGKPSLALVALRQFLSPLVYILAAAAGVSIVLGRFSDASFIVAVILLNAAIGAWQEWRAETSAASLKRTLRLSPIVVRAGNRRTVDAAELVPGDIVLLDSGAAVPADLRLMSAQDLRVDQSLLTGESAPAKKDAARLVGAGAVVGDRSNMAHAGTMVVSGRALGVVCATGAQTELGAVAKLLAGAGARPPLLLRMEVFSNRVAATAIALTLFIGVGQFARGEPMAEIFLFAIALAVSAIPEGLPVAITVALAIASGRMAKREVIVRQLPAVEALGSCTLIAADKTGTLTVNRLTAKEIVLAPDGEAFDVEGEGLELTGAVRARNGDGDADAQTRLRRLARAAALTNEAEVHGLNGAVEARGDAVDVAFLVFAAKVGLRREDLRKTHVERASLPYEPRRGYSASLDVADSRATISVKGAPERVLPMCDGVDKGWTQRELHRLTSAGHRVLAVAEGEADASDGDLEAERLHGLEFLGFVGLIDPLRSEAGDAVASARAAGIDVRMITGDHPETALAIARQLDPSRPGEKALTGAELARLSGPERARAVREASVFARVEPAQKHLIVTELMRQGHFVAVTGDGVNDAPALKAAHVGVAMGAGGTDVARAASDLIIADDNFASIVAGVEEGRTAYNNIRKIVWLLISTAVAEITVFGLALAAGAPMPLTAVQILWLNLVTEGVQDVALGAEAKEPDVMRRGPRRPREPIFDRQMIEQCVAPGLYIGALAFGLFAWLHGTGGYDEAAARNLTLLFLVSFNNFHVLNCRSETRSFFRIPVSANPALIASIIGAQGIHIAAMHIPILQDVLKVGGVSVREWTSVIALAATVLLVGEGYKWARARPRAAHLRQFHPSYGARPTDASGPCRKR